jgi:hypothetical protein
MRKSFASLVMTALLLMAAAPLLALAPQTLPACCRTGGDHHCATMMHMGGEGFGAQTPSCPYRHGPAVAPGHSALEVPRVAFAFTEAHGEVYVAAASAASVTSAYSVPQRGPPLS